MDTYYVIRSAHDDQLFWSNHYGWASTEQETKFTPADREAVSLPIGGQWVFVCNSGTDGD